MNMKKITPYLFLIPSLFFFLFFVVYPTIDSVYISFHRWDGISPIMKFVGLTNYKKLFFDDPYFLNALKNNIIWTVIFLIFPTSLGLFIAMMVNENIRGENVFKAIIYFPMTLSFIVVGLIWTWIYEPRLGILNNFLKTIGLDSLAKPWLGSRQIVLYAVIIAASWPHTAFCMVVFLAGLRAIPVEAIEAAKIDGASTWQSFRHIILPLLRPALTIVIALTIIVSSKVFDIVYLMTMGGPARSSEVLALYMYLTSFLQYRRGYGCAIAVVIFLVVFSVAVPYIKRMTEKEAEL